MDAISPLKSFLKLYFNGKMNKKKFWIARFFLPALNATVFKNMHWKTRNSLLFAGKHSIEDLNATQPTADSTLQFRYRLLNSEEDEENSTENKKELKVEKVKEKIIVFPAQKEIVFPTEKKNDVAPQELLTQPSTVKEKFEKKIYSYSPFPSQSDPHPVKVVNSLPKHPATKDIASAYEHNSYPKHEYTALHDYNSYPSPSQEYISYPTKNYPAQNYYSSPAPEYENYPVYPPHAFFQNLYHAQQHPQYKVSSIFLICKTKVWIL